MNDKEEKINQNYVEAILKLYSELTKKEKRIELEFRTKMLQAIKKDFSNGKITEETYYKAKEELEWAMAREEMNLKMKETNIVENSRKDDEEISENREISEEENEIGEEINETESFRNRLKIRQIQNRRLKTDDLIRMIKRRREYKSSSEQKDCKNSKLSKNSEKTKNDRGER